MTEDESPDAAPGWFVTYADMMSLLLGFFILLASMSEIRTETRVLQAVDAMQRQFGGDEPLGEAAAKPKEPVPAAAPLRIKSPVGEPGMVVGGTVTFAEDASVLSAAERARLAEIVAPLQGKLQKIEIRGHSTRRPLPPGSPHVDHWDLAYARCHEVLKAVVAAGIDSRRLRLSVAAGNEPLRSGDEDRERRENSRVELFLLNEFNADIEKSGATAARAQTLR